MLQWFYDNKLGIKNFQDQIYINGMSSRLRVDRIQSATTIAAHANVLMKPTKTASLAISCL